MAYRFKPTETFDNGAVRILCEQIDDAHAHLSKGEDREKAVHEARKCMKKCRALLRLARPVIPGADYARENARFRDIARMLAGQRDADVMRGTLESLRGKGTSKTVTRTRAALEMTLPDSDRAEGNGAVLFADALTALAAGREAVADIAFPDEHIAEAVTAGVEATYKKGRRDWREVAGEPDHEEAWHDWRKRVQAHWRQMQLLSAAWPDWFSARAQLASELSDVLGLDHDLFILKAHITSLPPPNGSGGGLAATDRRRVTAVIENRQAELRARALELGDILYACPPARLIGEIGQYWSLAAGKPGIKRARRAARRQPASALA